MFTVKVSAYESALGFPNLKLELEPNGEKGWELVSEAHPHIIYNYIDAATIAVFVSPISEDAKSVTVVYTKERQNNKVQTFGVFGSYPAMAEQISNSLNSILSDWESENKTYD